MLQPSLRSRSVFVQIAVLCNDFLTIEIMPLYLRRQTYDMFIQIVEITCPNSRASVYHIRDLTSSPF
jgi:hypothetical protein